MASIASLFLCSRFTAETLENSCELPGGPRITYETGRQPSGPTMAADSLLASPWIGWVLLFVAAVEDELVIVVAAARLLVYTVNNHKLETLFAYNYIHS